MAANGLPASDAFFIIKKMSKGRSGTSAKN